jgi:hypothetical protein
MNQALSRIVRALRATYNFFAGDAILLGATVLAFALAFALGHIPHIPGVIPAVVFVGLIVAGLAATLGREVAGRPRRR